MFQQECNDIISRLGENHPDYATCINDLGLFYLKKGRYNEALLCLEKSLGIRKRIFPKDHPDYIASLGNLGLLYGITGMLHLLW
jgi:tetratricopeptide (TPR) repeat protein